MRVSSCALVAGIDERALHRLIPGQRGDRVGRRDDRQQERASVGRGSERLHGHARRRAVDQMEVVHGPRPVGEPAVGAHTEAEELFGTGDGFGANVRARSARSAQSGRISSASLRRGDRGSIPASIACGR